MAEVELPTPHELAEKRETAFSRRVALVTAVYAVVLAIAGVGGKYTMKEMLLAQQQASDQWAFYQAKVIREHLYRAQRLNLDVALAEPGALSGAQRRRFQALAKQFAEEEVRYNTEKKDIEKDAKKLEHERDVYRSRDPYFDYAEVMLQIAIVCSSVSILATSRPMLSISLVLAGLGALLTVNGFTLLIQIPLLQPR